MRERTERNWRLSPRVAESTGAVLLALAGLRYMLLYFNRATNLLDEGSQAAQASRILHGDLIYRDFITVVTPGSYYTVAWLFRIFGADLIVLRWAVVALGLGILLVTLGVARHLMSWPFAAASAFLTIVWGWFLVTPNLYSWQAMFLALTALLAYLRYARTSLVRWIFLAGLATGAAILVKQNIGVYAAAALLLTIWLSVVFEPAINRDQFGRRLRASICFTGGVCAPVVPVLLFLVLAGAGPNLYENWFYYPREVYPRGLGLPYPPFYPLVPQPGLETLREAIPALIAGRIAEPALYELWTKCVLYLPLLVYPFALLSLAALIARWLRTRDPGVAREGQTLLAIALFGALTFLQAWPRSDETHILFGMQPGFILLGYVLFCCWRPLDGVPARLRNRAALRQWSPTRSVQLTLLLLLEATVLLATLLPLGALLRNGYKRTEFEYQNYTVPLHADRAHGIFTSSEEVARIEQVTRYITTHTSTNEPIFVVPWAAGFYFLTDRPNPTRYDLLLSEDPLAYPCLIAALDRSKPRYVIYGYVWDVDGKHFSDYARPIDEYVRTRYRVETTFQGYEIWRRAHEEATILGSGSGDCKPWVRSPKSYLRTLGASLRRLFQRS